MLTYDTFINYEYDGSSEAESVYCLVYEPSSVYDGIAASQLIFQVRGEVTACRQEKINGAFVLLLLLSSREDQLCPPTVVAFCCTFSHIQDLLLFLQKFFQQVEFVILFFPKTEASQPLGQ